MKRVFICINGILTLPGDAEGWTDRAVTWLHLHTPAKAEKFEYASGVLTRRLRQQARAEAIARMVDYYHSAGWAVSMIGHSNGCDLIARVLKLRRAVDFLSVHLFAPAADAVDFEASLRINLDHCYVYGSPDDGALRLASWSRRLFGWAGLGYGSLGLHPHSVIHPNATGTVKPGYDHSTWWARGTRFQSTMHLIQEAEFPALSLVS